MEKLSQIYYFCLFFLRMREPEAPIKDTKADRTNEFENVPVVSLIHPATAGPIACPTPKKSVINPRPAGANLPPTASPAAAAMIVGMEKAVIPNTKAET